MNLHSAFICLNQFVDDFNACGIRLKDIYLEKYAFNSFTDKVQEGPEIRFTAAKDGNAMTGQKRFPPYTSVNRCR